MDNSFLRFLTDFNKAKDLQNSKTNDFDYDIQIHLKPGESYSLITNCPDGIAFDNLYKAYIVDCNNTVLLEITNNVFIEEFTNSETGLQQIKLEIVKIPGDFYTDLCFLRLDHNILSGNQYWTNGFLLSEYDINETLRFRFKNYSNLEGTNYSVANIFQSIRLKCLKVNITFTSSKQQYTTFQGLVNTSRLIKTKYYEYIFDICSDFIYERLIYILSHDIIYIDSVRVTEKQTFENADKISDTTNVSQNKFKCAVNELDIDSDNYQIYQKQELLVVNKTPSGIYNQVSYNSATANNTIAILEFNNNVSILPGDIEILLYVNGVVSLELFIINIVLNVVRIDLSGSTININNDISITVEANKIYFDTQDGREFFKGIVQGEWTFKIVDGDYSTSDYSTDYL